MRTKQSYFADYLGKKIHYDGVEAILDSVSLSHLGLYVDSHTPKVAMIDECDIIVPGIEYADRYNIPHYLCVMRLDEAYIPIDDVQTKSLAEVESDILEKICECCNVTPDELYVTRKQKRREYVWARHIHISIRYLLFGMNDSKASSCYEKSRTTVGYINDKVNSLLEFDVEYQNKFRSVWELISRYFNGKNELPNAKIKYNLNWL